MDLYGMSSQYYDYNPKYRVPDKLFTPLHGVKLTGGLFRDAFDNAGRFLLNQLDPDRTRYWFDQKAGRPTDAIPYIGHFEWNIRSQTASTVLMGLGNMLRWEENGEMRAEVEKVLDYIEEDQETNGFLLPIEKDQFAYREYPHYVRIWMNYALLAAANSGSKRAFRMLRLWQDWFNRCPDLKVIKYLELAFQAVVGSTIVYNSEIGVDEDMEITREYYEEPWRLAQFLSHEREAVYTRNQPGHEPHPHGTELEAYEGYLDLYRYTGAPYYLNAVRDVVSAYKAEWQHPGGGIIMCEHLRGNAVRKYALWYTQDHTYNEICASSFWLGIHQRLHRLFPDVEAYTFEVEQTIYNCIIAAQKGDADFTSFTYLDERKRPPIRPNHCCVGIGSKIIGCLPEYVFTLDKHTLSLDLYASAELKWQTAHQTITVTETTDYPANGKVSVKFDMPAAEGFDVRVRIPQYAASDVTLYVNGTPAGVGKPGTYQVLYRNWEPGDVLSFEIPFAFRVYPYRGEDKLEGCRRFAYSYGPCLLAFAAGDDSKNLILEGDPYALPGKLRLHDEGFADGNWAFTLEGAENVSVVPYHTICEERFTCFPHFR